MNDKSMIVISGTASRATGSRLAELFSCPHIIPDVKKFPDGELYARINHEIKGEEVVLLQSTYPNDSLLELFILQDAISRLEPDVFTTVIPYYGYSRQDKLFKKGEAVTASLLAGLIEINTDEIITVNIHDKGTLNSFTRPVKNVSAMPDIGLHLQKLGAEYIISPDKGAVYLAKEAAEIVDCPWDHLEKTRIDGNTVSMKVKSLDVKGRRVAIVDDIISTGGTILKASEHLMAAGAKEVMVGCVHGLFTGGGLDRLKTVCSRIVSTDTLENPSTAVSAADAVFRSMTE